MRILLLWINLIWISCIIAILGAVFLGQFVSQYGTISFFSRKADETRYWLTDLDTGLSVLLGNYPSTDFDFTEDGRYALFSLRDEEEYLWLERDGDTSLIQAEINGVIAFSEDGQYLYEAQMENIEAEYSEIRRIRFSDNQVETIGRYNWQASQISISPDSRQLAIFDNFIRNLRDEQSLILFNLETGFQFQLSFIRWIKWSPDSRWIAASNNIPNMGTFTVFDAANGSLHPLLPPMMEGSFPQWSPDSQFIYVWQQRQEYEISILTGEIRPIETEFNQLHMLTWSPDNRYGSATYLSEQGYRQAIYRRSDEAVFTLNTETKPLSDAGFNAVWSPDSRYLLLQVLDGNLDTLSFELYETETAQILQSLRLNLFETEDAIFQLRFYGGG